MSLWLFGLARAWACKCQCEYEWRRVWAWTRACVLLSLLGWGRLTM